MPQDSSHSSGLSAQLVAHLRKFREGSWDAKTLRSTKLCLLDSLGCFSSGLHLPHFTPAAAVAKSMFGTSVGASNLPISPFLMAYIYGQAANALDYDDTLFGHPGAPIIGATLSTAASYRLPLDRLLRGIAAGYEAHFILSASAVASPERAALVRSVGVWDTVAAAVGAGIALDLSDEMLKRIIGVAVTHSVLPYTAKWYERPVPAVKNNMGWVAAGAVLSVNLAAAGLSGVTAPLDGESGMWRMAGSDRWSLNKTLFDKPAVLRVGFKQYPACWFIQEHLKGYAQILASIAPGDEVAQITVRSPVEIEKFCPSSLTGTADVGFSLPATFSLLTAGVEPGPQWDFFDASGTKQEFRYERAEHRTIRVLTRTGAELTVDVGTSEPLDLSNAGLDEAGVVVKYKRLADELLQSQLAEELSLESVSRNDSVPNGLYETIARMMGAEPGLPGS